METSKELLKAYHFSVNFFEEMQGTPAAEYVLQKIETPETLRDEVRRMAHAYGCDYIRSSFNEDSYYLFCSADSALSALIKAEQPEPAEPVLHAEPEEMPEPAGLIIPEDICSAVVGLCEDMNPWDFEESMIPDLKQGLSDYPWETVSWIDEDILKYPDDITPETYQQAVSIREKLVSLMNAAGIDCD